MNKDGASIWNCLKKIMLLAQPVPQITYEDGTAVPALDIKNGAAVRATVQQSETGGLGGEPVLASSNLAILRAKNE